MTEKYDAQSEISELKNRLVFRGEVIDKMAVKSENLKSQLAERDKEIKRLRGICKAAIQSTQDQAQRKIDMVTDIRKTEINDYKSQLVVANERVEVLEGLLRQYMRWDRHILGNEHWPDTLKMIADAKAALPEKGADDG